MSHEVLANQIYKLLFAISDTMIPVTFMRYPRITNDCSYLYHKLKPILQDITFDLFSSKFNMVANSELVHNFGEADCSQIVPGGSASFRS